MQSHPAHPGEIVFVDEDAGTEKTLTISEVPSSVAFVDTDAGPIPVTRVVARRRGQQREIQSFGADGGFLASTLQAPPAS